MTLACEREANTDIQAKLGQPPRVQIVALRNAVESDNLVLDSSLDERVFCCYINSRRVGMLQLV